MSSSYEQKVYKILKNNRIYFVREKTFKDLRGGLLRFDIYIPNFHGGPVCFEIDGQYHWYPIQGQNVLLKQKENDRRKNAYCLAHNIPLYRIPY